MSTLAWGGAAMALCVLLGVMIGWPLGHARGLKHAEEEAWWQAEDRRWKRAEAEAARPVPVRPPVPDPPRAGPGKHRHPGGPPQHAARPVPARPPVPDPPRPALPVAGYLPAPDGMGPWNGTITVPAPVQPAPWDLRPPEPEPEPEPTVVLEPTAILAPPVPDALSDSAWTRRMAEDMDRWIAEHIGATDPVLKEITR